MKIKKEFKIGVFAVIVILVAWWGIKWLQGQDLFKSYNNYYILYEEVSRDLKVSSRVYISGVNVGTVSDIELQPDRKVRVEISVEDKYAAAIADNSLALITEGLMGGAQIEIQAGDGACAVDGAMLPGELDKGLMGLIADKATQLIDGIDATIKNLNEILEGNKDALGNMIANIESMTASLDVILADVGGDVDGMISDLRTFTSALSSNTERLDSMLANLDSFTGDLAESDIINQVDATLDSLNDVVGLLKDSEGSIGKLLNDNELYDQLTLAGNNLAVLLDDLKQNPMRYVHFSLFGKSEEQIAQKAAKKAAREARRNERAGIAVEAE